MQGNDQYVHVNNIKLHVRSNSEEVVEKTRQLLNTMKAEMPKGMLEMSVGAGEEEEEDKSKYLVHFQGHNQVISVIRKEWACQEASNT